MNGFNECAGMRVVKSSLEPNRMEVVRSMLDRGPYGQIEDWSGSIEVEATNRCHMSPDAQQIVAEVLASSELPRNIIVNEWDVKQVGAKFTLIPREWEEIEVDSHLKRVFSLLVLIIPGLLLW